VLLTAHQRSDNRCSRDFTRNQQPARGLCFSEQRSDMGAKDIHAQLFGRGRGGREQLAVPRAKFRSYCGRAALKTSVSEWPQFPRAVAAARALRAAAARVIAAL